MSLCNEKTGNLKHLSVQNKLKKRTITEELERNEKKKSRSGKQERRISIANMLKVTQRMRRIRKQCNHQA